MNIMYNMSAWNTMNHMRMNQNQKMTAMERLASGLRINRAADDAAGLSISEKMRGQIKGLQQAARNIQDGISLLQTAEGGMQEVHAMLQRMNQLAVQASTGTYDDRDRSKAALEFNQMKNEIKSISKGTNFNRIPLLDGRYSGAEQGTYSQVTGSKVLNGNVQIDSTNDTLQFQLDSGQVSITLGHGSYTSSDLVQHINTQLSNQHVELRASLMDGKLNFSSTQIGNHAIHQVTGSGMSLMLNTVKGEPAKYVVAGEALLTPSKNIVKGVNDTLTFDVDGTSYTITLDEGTYDTPLHANPDTSPLAMEINKKLMEQSIPISAGYGGFVGNHPSLPGNVFSSCLTFDGEVGNIGNFGGSAKDTLLGNLWTDQLQGGTQSRITGAANVAMGMQIINGINDTIEIEINGTIKSYTLSEGNYNAADLINELNHQLLSDHITATLSNGNVVLSQSDGYAMKISGGSLSRDLFFSYSLGEKAATSNQGISIQIGNEAQDQVTLSMPSLNLLVQKLDVIDLSTAAGANNALSLLNHLVDHVSIERAKLGAYQNRLQQTANHVLNYIENLSASESRIRDADMAKEITQSIRAKIIMDAGQSMLAQANMIPQHILSLLK